MPFDPYMQKALLDWTTGAAAATQPVGRFIGLASGSGNTQYDSAAPGYRATATFQSASTAANLASASLKAALTCTMTAACTNYYWNLYDATNAGNRLMYGTLAASMTQASGDACGFAAANFKISLA